jgi:hypothetical protein
MKQFPKACNVCGKAITSLAEWKLLPMVGAWEDEEEALEMRNCSCGSTLAIQTLDKLTGEKVGK